MLSPETQELPAFRASDPEHTLAACELFFPLSRHGIISQKGFPNEFPAVVPFEQPAGIHVQGKEVSVQVRTMPHIPSVELLSKSLKVQRKNLCASLCLTSQKCLFRKRHRRSKGTFPSKQSCQEGSSKCRCCPGLRLRYLFRLHKPLGLPCLRIHVI